MEIRYSPANSAGHVRRPVRYLAGAVPYPFERNWECSRSGCKSHLWHHVRFLPEALCCHTHMVYIPSLNLCSFTYIFCRAPIIALYADLTTSVPIFVSGAMFLGTGFIALLIPFEPRGKASL